MNKKTCLETMLAAAIAATPLWGCELADESDESMPPEALSHLERATVDLGDGPQEIFFEDIDGMAVMEGDMVLGPTALVASGDYRLRPLNDLSNDELVPYSLVQTYNAWPGGIIPYEEAPPANWGNGNSRSRVRVGIQEWNATGLIRFVPRTNESTYLLLQMDDEMGGAGKSTVGAQPNATLTVGPTISLGTAIHELGHALGLKHEQTRPDRDDYVQIFCNRSGHRLSVGTGDAISRS